MVAVNQIVAIKSQSIFVEGTVSNIHIDFDKSIWIAQNGYHMHVHMLFTFELYDEPRPPVAIMLSNCNRERLIKITFISYELIHV